MPSPSPLDRFVVAVQRRMGGMRIVEGAGVGLGIAAGVVLVLAAVLIWRDRPVAGPAAIVLAIGAAAGGLWGLLRRPSRLHAAIEADRQLRLHDLLATAWSVRDSDDPWAMSVRALAEAQVATIRPGRVVLHRLGVRAWGGIVSSVLLVAAVVGFYERPRASVASSEPPRFVDPAELEKLAHAVPPAYSARPNWLGPDASTPIRPQTGARELDPHAKADPSATLTADEGHPTSPVAAEQGAGGGSAATDAARAEAPAPPESADRPASAATAGADAGGTGRSTPADATGAADSSPTAAAGEAQPVEPWRAQDWTDRRSQALQAIESGIIPPQYRPFIRGYFSDDAPAEQPPMAPAMH